MSIDELVGKLQSRTSVAPADEIETYIDKRTWRLG